MYWIVRSNSNMKIFVIVAVCIIATLHECTGACTKCTSCLSGVLNIPAASSSTIDQGKCPSKSTLEYNQLQQIELMFRKSELSRKTPCRRVCVACRHKILQTCNKCSSNPDSNKNCESFDILTNIPRPRPCDREYPGLFFESATAYDNAMKSVSAQIVSKMSVSADIDDSIKAQASANVQASARAASGSNSSCDDPCRVEWNATYYNESIYYGRETWYPLWFKTGDMECRQYYVKVSCPSTNCPSLRRTARTFVFTTIAPDPDYGHADHFFLIDKRNASLNDITFFSNILLPGYCVMKDECEPK